MKNHFHILLVIISTAFYSNAQQISFQKTYDFGYTEAGNCVKQTPDSGYIVAGRADPFSLFGTKMLIMKTDKYGLLQWSTILGDGVEDYIGYYITNCSDGGYAAVGYLDGVGFVQNIYVVRLNNNGDTLWTNHYGTGEQETGNCIQETATHDFVIAFSSHDSTGILKIDSVGNVLFWKKYSLYNGASFYNIFELSSGGYIASGVAEITGYQSQGILMRTDSIGDSIWVKQYGGLYGDEFYEAQQTIDGNIIVGGISIPNTSSGFNSYVLKLNMNGDTIWTKHYGGGNTADDGCKSIANCSDGGYIISGTVHSTGTSDDMFITKINSNGDSLWTQHFGGADADYGYFVRQTNDSGYILAGETASGDVYLIKTDSVGYAPVGIKELNNQSNIFTVYPNPTNCVFTINLNKEYRNIQIEITDIVGNMIYNTIAKETNQINVALTEPTGLYFVTVVADEQREVMKLIKE